MDRFGSRLTGQKAKCLSFGGGLTLKNSVLSSMGGYSMSIFHVSVTMLNYLERMRASFFWRVDLDDRRMHWIQQDRVLAARDDAGLGVGSLFAYKRALLLRWRWRLHFFFHYLDLLWIRVVKVLYGLDGHSSPLILGRSWSGSWNGITWMLANLNDRGFNFHAICPIKIGYGAYTSFWHDIWLGDTPLVVSFHRVFVR